jgi:hypothetical protein
VNLPPEVINYWPEVLQGLSVKTIPMPYISKLTVKFKNGAVWGLSVDNIDTLNLINTYADSILDVDITINIEKIKSDSTNIVKGLLN